MSLRGTRQNGGPRGLRGAHVRAHQGAQLVVDHIALVWGKLLVMPGEVPLQLQLVCHLDRLVQVGDEIWRHYRGTEREPQGRIRYGFPIPPPDGWTGNGIGYFYSSGYSRAAPTPDATAKILFATVARSAIRMVSVIVIPNLSTFSIFPCSSCKNEPLQTFHRNVEHVAHCYDKRIHRRASEQCI